LKILYPPGKSSFASEMSSSDVSSCDFSYLCQSVSESSSSAGDLSFASKRLRNFSGPRFSEKAMDKIVEKVNDSLSVDSKDDGRMELVEVTF
jgi:hypothetical protein